MPIRINESLTHNEEEFNQLTEDIIGIVMLGNTIPCGNYYDEQNKTHLLAFDLKDADTGDVDLRCVFTLQEMNGKNEVNGIDVVVPNDRIQMLDFIEKEDEESSNTREVWNVENDDKRGYVETVNRLVYPGEIKGKVGVSLCAIPYGEQRFGDSAEEISKAFGFKPTVYKWQEEMGMGTEPITLGFADDFTAPGFMLSRVLSHRKVRIEIGKHIYDAVITDLETGFGTLSAVFSDEYSEEIADGRFVMMQAELKADFSFGENNYYGEISYLSEEFSQSFNRYFHNKTYRSFAMDYIDENPNYLVQIVKKGLDQGTRIKNYYGEEYINHWFKCQGNFSRDEATEGNDIQLVLNTVKENGQTKIRSYDFHTTGALCPELEIVRELNDSKLSPDQKKLLVRLANGEEETPFIINVVNSAILPSYLPGDIISPQLAGLAGEFKYFDTEEEYHKYLADSNIEDMPVGSYRIPCGEGEDPKTKCYGPHDYEILISGKGWAPYANKTVFEDKTDLTTFVYLWVETKLGNLPVAHTINVSEEVLNTIKHDSIFFGKIALQGDALIYGYDKGIVLDHYNDIRALRYYLTNNDSDRIRSIMCDDISFCSSSTGREVHGKDEVIAYFDSIHKQRALPLDSKIGHMIRRDESVECIRTYFNGIADQDIFIELNEEGLIQEIIAQDRLKIDKVEYQPRDVFGTFEGRYSFARNENDGKTYLIDMEKLTSKIIPEKYQNTPCYLFNPYCGGYCNGLVMVSEMGKVDLAYHHTHGAAGKWGWLDTDLNVVIEPQYIFAEHFMDNGLAMVAKGDLFVGKDGNSYDWENERWGLINKKGEEVMPIIYDDVYSVDGDDSLYIVHKGGWKEGSYALYDLKTNKETIQFDFDIDLDYMFNEVFVNDDNKLVFLDHQAGEGFDYVYVYDLTNGECIINKEKFEGRTYNGEKTASVEKDGETITIF